MTDNDPKYDENGDMILTLLIGNAGRSALDIAQDSDSTLELLCASIEEERVCLNGHEYKYTWSVIQAAKEGKMSALRRLIEAGASMQPKPGLFERGGSPIEQASKYSHHDVVKYLLEQEKAKIEKDAFTPEALEEAVENSQHEEVERLLKAQKFLKRAQSNKTQALRRAAANGDLPLVEMLYASGATPDGVGDDYPYTTALERAAKHGHTATVQYLLGKGAAVGKHHSDATALKRAASGGFLEIVEDLLNAGADVNADNALHAAAFGGHLDVVNWLLDAGAGVDTSNEWENRYKPGHLTALHEAARGGHLDVVQRLIEVGADVNALPGEGHSTALRCAAQNGSVEVVRYLLAAGAHVIKPDEDYRSTALQAAAAIGSLEIVDVLLEAGASRGTSASGDDVDAPAFKEAIENGHITVAERIMDHMDPERWDETPKQLSQQLLFALRAAATGGHEGLVTRLLDIGVSNFYDLVAETAAKGHTSIVKMLLDAGAAISGTRSRKYQTALQWAVKGDHIDTARLLIERGADVNAAPWRPKSPLHVACRKGNVDMVKMLLEAGANVHARSYSGKSVRRSATKGANLEIIQLVDDAEAKIPAPPDTNLDIDVDTITKKGLCTVCQDLPFEVFDRKARRRYETGAECWHQSLISLRDGVQAGCPFCMFFWKQLGITKITIPQPSVCCLYQNSYGGVDVEMAMWSQVEEPCPKDVECPDGLRADFHVILEPFGKRRKGLPGDTGSDATFRQIESWIDKCKSDHDECAVERGTWFLPTRLVDLTQWANDRTLRLVESKNIDNEQGQPPLYMTLSYRWAVGTTAAASTTTSNLSERLHSVSTTSLPLLFVHAIEAAHKLHVPFIWIDSLCIVQDSEEDFATEAAMMGKIYRHSYCTISAGLDDTAESGLFRAENAVNNSVEIDLRNGKGESKRVRFVRRQDGWEQMFGKGPLQERGW
jgi:ankyrin repeat protein